MVSIYLITNFINGKSYVGKTINPIKDRWSRHVYAAKTGLKNYFANSIRKYGPRAFFMFKLDETPNWDESSEIEKFYIRLLRTNEKAFGYNTTGGGEGMLATPEVRLKISQSNRGRIVSEETRRKQGEKAKGRMTRLRRDIPTPLLENLYNSNLSTTLIGSIFGIQKTTVQRRLRKVGITLKRGRPRK